MSEHLAWYVARATGIVAWALLVATIVWGLAPRWRAWPVPAVHRFLGGLSVTFVAVHVVAVVADGYTAFGPVEVLLPLASAWEPVPVALGIVAAYLLVAIEVTSVLARRLPRRVWRGVHLSSYAVVGLGTLHGLYAGTDVGGVVGDGALAAGVGAVAGAGSLLAVVARTSRVAPAGRTVPGGSRGSVPERG